MPAPRLLPRGNSKHATGEGGFVLVGLLGTEDVEEDPRSAHKSGQGGEEGRARYSPYSGFSTSDRSPKRTAADPNAMPNVDKGFRGRFQGTTSPEFTRIAKW
jgi:hypothetical protein